MHQMFQVCVRDIGLGKVVAFVRGVQATVCSVLLGYFQTTVDVFVDDTGGELFLAEWASGHV